MRLLIIKTGSTIPGLRGQFGDFEDWFARDMGIGNDYLLAEVQADPALPDPHGLDGVLITGSPAMVSRREPWSEATAGWLARAADRDLPMLGVCYGHQLLAHALGGRVGPNPAGRQIGTVGVDFRAEGDPLLGSLGPSRDLQTTHVESVLELPPGASVLATTDRDPHHAFRLGRHVWGVQFHPEFEPEVMRGYLRARRPELEAEGLPVDRLVEQVRPAPAGPELLGRFARLLGQRDGEVVPRAAG